MSFNDVQIEGTYALKLPTAQGYRSFEHEFELKVIDYHDRPENFHRAWAVFSLGNLKGVLGLWSVETDLRLRRSMSPSPDNRRCPVQPQHHINGATNGKNSGDDSPNHGPDSNRKWITVPDIWGYSFQVGDMLRFHWRGCDQPQPTLRPAERPMNRLEQILSSTAARLIGGPSIAPNGTTQQLLTDGAPTNGHRSIQQPETKHGLCHITFVSHNSIRVDWEVDQEVQRYDGQRLPGNLSELRNTRPLDLRDIYGRGWEDLQSTSEQPER